MAIKRVGACLHCGNCCKAFVQRLHIDPENEGAAEDYLRYLSYRKDIKIHRASRLDVDIEFLHACEFLELEGQIGNLKSKCLAYDKRPELCRKFPEVPAKLCRGFQFIVESGEEENAYND